MLVILSLLSSILSTALTSDQIYPSFGKEPNKIKTKETKTKSKSASNPKGEDKSKEDNSKTKDDNTPHKETDNKKTNTKEGDTKGSSSPDNASPQPPVTTDNASPQPPVTTDNASPQPPVTTDNQLTSQSPICNPSTQSCPSTNPTTIIPNDIIQQPCIPTIKKCPPITNSNQYTRCPVDYRTNDNGSCHYVGQKCTLPKDKCPPIICEINDCPKDLKCPNGYHRDIDGLCHSINCNPSKEKCIVCDPITKKCLPPTDNNENKRSSDTDTVIKYYITNPIIQQQITQQPSNSLIPIDTLQFCNQIGDQVVYLPTVT